MTSFPRMILIAVILLGTAAHAQRTATPPARRVPYSTLADLPRDAWYRGLPPYTLRNITEWQQVAAVDPPWVALHGRWYRPEELLTRFVWTSNPFADDEQVAVNSCGKSVK